MGSDASILWLFFGFRGRINRKAFLLGGLAMVVVTMFVLYRVSIAQELARGLDFWSTILAVVVFVSLWCQAALAAKRLHDMDQPGFWAVSMFVPILNFFAFIALCILKGTPGENRFGPTTNLPN
ncbi:DUF805 domain-containing protein [Tianweitania aestuarii]|nr:DUF805 domain-containing protein [Tianweitania aestuarii]